MCFGFTNEIPKTIEEFDPNDKRCSPTEHRGETKMLVK